MADGDHIKYSISEVAQMAGVSPSTVSRALNGKKGVGNEQREKIIRLAEKLGYQPNSLLHSHGAAVRKGLIALIVGDIRNPFYTDLEYRIQRILSANGDYMVVVFNTEYAVDRELAILKMAERSGFSGIIMVTAQSEELQEALAGSSMPKVLVNRILPSYRGDSVLTDNFQAGYLAAMHLIDLSHKNIGYVRGPLISSASFQRFEGFQQALSNFGLSIREENIFDCDLMFESGRRCGEEFLARDYKDRPTAMVVGNDSAALGFIDACRKAGVSIPEELSVISFDDIVYSSIEGINLTTVSQHVEEMSRETARLLLRQLEGNAVKPERIIISPELIVRGTTAAPASTWQAHEIPKTDRRSV